MLFCPVGAMNGCCGTSRAASGRSLTAAPSNAGRSGPAARAGSAGRHARRRPGHPRWEPRSARPPAGHEQPARAPGQGGTSVRGHAGVNARHPHRGRSPVGTHMLVPSGALLRLRPSPCWPRWCWRAPRRQPRPSYLCRGTRRPGARLRRARREAEADDGAEPPQHPFMAANPGSNIHDDAYMTDTYRGSGPLARPRPSRPPSTAPSAPRSPSTRRVAS